MYVTVTVSVCLFAAQILNQYAVANYYNNVKTDENTGVPLVSTICSYALGA